MSVLDAEVNSELNKIEEQIDEAIDKQVFYISVYEKLNPCTVFKLKQLGYSVSENLRENDYYYFISWYPCDVYKSPVQDEEKINEDTTNDVSVKTQMNNAIFSPYFALEVIVGLFILCYLISLL